MKDMLAAVYGFVLWAFAMYLFVEMWAYGYAHWQVAAVQNRTMMVVQQRGGVDDTVRDLIRQELQQRKIVVNRVTGTVPKTPYGDPVTLEIGASFRVLGREQPVGQRITGTSIYRERR